MVDKKFLLQTLSKWVSGDYTYRYDRETYQKKDYIYELLMSNLKDFKPDFTNDEDKQLVNKIFAAIVVCVSGYYDEPGGYNTLMRLSIFKHICDKLTALTNSYLKIEFYQKIIDNTIYIKVSVIDKIRYYKFNNACFVDSNKEIFESLTTSHKCDNSGEVIDFLPLTEME